MKKITALYSKVKVLLESDPKFRDSDERLVARLINNELKAKAIDPQNISAYEYLRMYAEGEIVDVDTITRARRSINQHYPSTRGKSYNSRIRRAEEVKAELRELAAPKTERKPVEYAESLFQPTTTA